MTFFRFFLLICCIIAITSYKIDHRPWEDRNERAVTEWRFRRNFLYPIFAYYPDYDEHIANMDNEYVEPNNDVSEKNFVTTSLLQSNE